MPLSRCRFKPSSRSALCSGKGMPTGPSSASHARLPAPDDIFHQPAVEPPIAATARVSVLPSVRLPVYEEKTCGFSLRWDFVDIWSSIVLLTVRMLEMYKNRLWLVSCLSLPVCKGKLLLQFSVWELLQISGVVMFLHYKRKNTLEIKYKNKTVIGQLHLSSLLR